MPKKAKWDEIPCPECKEPVAWNATRCPRCQAVYSRQQIDARKQTHMSSQKLGAGCFAVVALLLVGMCAFTGGDEPSSNTSSASNESSAEVPKSGSASPAVVAAFTRLNDDIMAAVDGCDRAGKALAERVDSMTKGSGSVYDAYSIAARMENACRESWRLVSGVDVPSDLNGAARDSAEKSRDVCENAMLAKQMSAEAMKEVFDGNMRPSAVDDLRQKANTAQAGTFACVGSIFDTGIKAGVDVSKLGEDKVSGK